MDRSARKHDHNGTDFHRRREQKDRLLARPVLPPDHSAVCQVYRRIGCSRAARPPPQARLRRRGGGLNRRPRRRVGATWDGCRLMLCCWRRHRSADKIIARPVSGKAKRRPPIRSRGPAADRQPAQARSALPVRHGLIRPANSRAAVPLVRPIAFRRPNPVPRPGAIPREYRCQSSSRHCRR